MEREFICEFCGNRFIRHVFPSSKRNSTFQYCSRGCSNKARDRSKIKQRIFIHKMNKCKYCGKEFLYRSHGTKVKQFCSKECCYWGRKTAKKIPPEVIQYIKCKYSKFGAKFMFEHIKKIWPVATISAIRSIAFRNNIHLEKNIYYELVHGSAKKFMTENNPMKREEVKEKVNKWQKNHPDIMKMNGAKASRHNSKLKSNKLEKRLHFYLDKLNIIYEPYCIIKPGFVVDIRIGRLIIQADGDYWHGHKRFEPLTERQVRQRKRDIAQDKYLSACGYIVERVWESDMGFDIIFSIIEKHNAILNG